MSLLKRTADWFDDRTGYRGLLDHALGEPIPGGASWAYVFGSVLTFIFFLQAVTGVLLAVYYSPSASDAWASVAYIQDQVTLGWFIRGLHHYGASAMVIVSGVHMLQVAVWGAYKKPRELNWIVGVLMLGIVLAFALTGYLLPWDQKGYWATKVATGILGSTPLLGGWLKELVQGGNEYGNLTLTRFYAIHVFVLPGSLMALLVAHIYLFRRHGVTPKWGRSKEDLDRNMARFWPDQLFRDMVAILVAFGILVGLTLRTHGAELFAPADPSSNFEARPEWYFLPLFQLLKYFSGAMEQVVALGLPLLAGVVLLGLPFVDRGPDRDPRRRIKYLGVIAAGFVGSAVLMALSTAEDSGNPDFQEKIAAARQRADRARELAREGVPVRGGTAVFENDPNFKAQLLWKDRCAGCHEGTDRKGPEIVAGYNSRAWIRDFLKDPNGQRFFGVTKGISEMEPVELEGADLDAVVELVHAQTGAEDADPKLVARGQELFDNGSCIDCHSIDYESTVDTGPNLGQRGTVKWLSAFIADPGHDRFFGEKLNEMPAFADKLTPEEIEALARYVASLRDAE